MRHVCQLARERRRCSAVPNASLEFECQMQIVKLHDGPLYGPFDVTVLKVYAKQVKMGC